MSKDIFRSTGRIITSEGRLTSQVRNSPDVPSVSYHQVRSEGGRQVVAPIDKGIVGQSEPGTFVVREPLTPVIYTKVRGGKSYGGGTSREALTRAKQDAKKETARNKQASRKENS